MLQTIEIYSIWFDLIWKADHKVPFRAKAAEDRPQTFIPAPSSQRQSTNFHPCSKQSKTDHRQPSLLRAAVKCWDGPNYDTPMTSKWVFFFFFFTIYSHTDYRVMAISASWDRWRRVLRVPETPAIVETAWNRLTQKPITRSVSTTETIRTPTVTLSVSVSDVTFQSFSICWRTRSCTKQAQNKEVFRLV